MRDAIDRLLSWLEYLLRRKGTVPARPFVPPTRDQLLCIYTSRPRGVDGRTVIREFQWQDRDGFRYSMYVTSVPCDKKYVKEAARQGLNQYKAYL